MPRFHPPAAGRPAAKAVAREAPMNAASACPSDPLTARQPVDPDKAEQLTARLREMMRDVPISDRIRRLLDDLDEDAALGPQPDGKN